MTVSGNISDSNDPVRKAEGRTLLGHIIARRSTPPRHLTAPVPTDDEIQRLCRNF